MLLIPVVHHVYMVFISIISVVFNVLIHIMVLYVDKTQHNQAVVVEQEAEVEQEAVVEQEATIKVRLPLIMLQEINLLQMILLRVVTLRY